MRNTLLATAAILGLACATQAAFAQAPTPDAAAPAPDAAPPAADAPTAAPDSGTMAPAAPRKMHHHHKMAAASGDEKFAHEPGTGESGPASAKASNIDQADSRSDIAPHLPMSKAGHDATADAYLGAAQRALRAHHTGEAQQSLEMAETRLLTRSTLAGSAGQPAQDPQVMQINEARTALGHGDMAAAGKAIKTALGTSGSPMGNGAMAAPAAGGGMTTTDTTSTSMSGSGMAGGNATHSTNAAPTGAPGMASSGAGVQPGASAGASTGGGPLGSGTADNPAGAK